MIQHLTDDDLVLLYYNEPEVTAAQKVHVERCDACRSSFAELTDSLRLAGQWHEPDLPTDFEKSVWARLAPKLHDNTRRDHQTSIQHWLQSILRPRIWGLATALALLLVGVFLAGRATRPLAKPALAGLSAKARERILVISLADHLERAGALLTDLSHSENGMRLATFDRERARDLVSESRVMQQALDLLSGRETDTSVPQFGSNRRNGLMLDELDRFLIEVANAPDRLSVAAMREWRQRIESDSLLFQVRVVETNLRTKGQKL